MTTDFRAVDACAPRQAPPAPRLPRARPVRFKARTIEAAAERIFSLLEHNPGRTLSAAGIAARAGLDERLVIAVLQRRSRRLKCVPLATRGGRGTIKYLYRWRETPG